MAQPLGKVSTTIFILGIIVSFSSLLFLVLFYNFSMAPALPVIISVLACAGFQLAAFLGGVVFEKRVWPPILYLLPCAIGTAWAGVMGPAALFGMPGTVFAGMGSGVSTPLYFATLPVTVVGVGVGVAYFALGVITLIADSQAIQADRHAPPVPEETLDRAAIYTQVTALLCAPDEDTPETAEPPPVPVASLDDKASKAPPADGPTQDVAKAAATERAENASEELGQINLPASETTGNEPLPAAGSGGFAPLKAAVGSILSQAAAKISTFFAVDTAEEGPVFSFEAATEGNMAGDRVPALPKPDTASENAANKNPMDETLLPAESMNDVLLPAAAEESCASGLAADKQADAQQAAFVSENEDDLLANWADTPFSAVQTVDLAVALETERLRIVRLDKSAFAALLRGVEEMEGAAGLAPSGEQLDAHTLSAFDRLYSQAIEDPDNYKWFAVWVLTSKAENKLMGSAGFKGAPNEAGEVELGYGVNEAQRGSGYATEAATALCRWALLQKNVCAVTAQTDVDNIGSTRVLEKVGMARVKQTDNRFFWRLEK